jgi:DNA mismatch repair protein MutS
MGKGQRVPMAGIPHHALEPYLARLIRKGHKVAICEQVSEPVQGQGLVDREVVRVVTPGTVVEPSLLEEKANNYLVAAVAQGDEVGFAYADITTAEFATAQMPLADLPLELHRLAAPELLVPEGQEVGQEGAPAGDQAHRVTHLPADAFDERLARRALLDHFGVATLEAYGCEGLPLAIRAAGAVLAYLRETQRAALPQLTGLHTYSPGSFMTLDPQTRRNLELFQAGRFGGGPSLLSVLDRTRTPMGGRLLRRWLGQPLLERPALERRLDMVSWFHGSAIRRAEAGRLLAGVADLERLINRVRSGVAIPREVVALGRSLSVVPGVLALLAEADDGAVQADASLRPCPEVVALVEAALVDDPGAVGGQAGVIREGFSPEMDGVRRASRDALEYIAGLERTERERTGIGSLKVGYNRVFGYYLEVSRANLSRTPEDYIRRQTLVNAERFITPDLKEHEAQVLGAQERLEEMEGALYRQVCQQIGEQADRVLETAAALARVDVFSGLAEVASLHGYVRPTLSDGDALDITAGRHPVVEEVIPSGTFVPNDTALGGDGPVLMLLTGPNMAGKSTYIRQVALIALMAQVGSFVPAESATVGLVDRIFTRVGLQDDLATGQSTFMVEMVETAAILHNATHRSLVVLDEIGRGTSTYDGLAIARAVAEYLHSHPRLGCKTLFATHYHELTGLAEYLPRAANFNVAVVEEGDRVIFLHRIVQGGADKSYGVHVARLAGLPQAVVGRAWDLLADLEANRGGEAGAGARVPEPRSGGRAPAPAQLPLWGAGYADAMRAVAGLDIATMTPLEALNRLYELQQTLKGLPGEEGAR